MSETTDTVEDLLKILADEATQFHKVIERFGVNRETSLAITKLEEAVMWCSQAIVMDEMKKRIAAGEEVKAEAI